MKKILSLLFLCTAIGLLVASCSSSKEINVTLDKKHLPLPDYVLNSSDLVQETYAMVSNYPEVVAGVPCYCGCYAQEGHESNLDCYIDSFGEDKAVTGWDSMSISWDVCIDIAREAVEMHLDGKSPKKIYDLITTKYQDFGEPTPTPEPK